MTTTTSRARPPQQARSRAALQRLLTAAEHVLVNDGIDEFTIARVAEQAGVSVGGVYRRFTSKEELIAAVRDELLVRLESTVTGALADAEPSLTGAVTALTSALSTMLTEIGVVLPILITNRTEAPEQGARTMSLLQQRFLDTTAPYRGQVHRPDPDTALMLAFRSVIGAAAHRAAVAALWPDGLSWPQWAHEIAAMTTAYLTSGGDLE